MLSFKKTDAVLIFIFIVIAAFAWFFGTSKTEAASADIYVGGVFYGSFSLFENNSIDIIPKDDGIVTNIVVIENGSAKMEFSSCTGQDCLRQGTVKSGGNIIVCLPNKIVVEITGKKNDTDAISR